MAARSLSASARGALTACNLLNSKEDMVRFPVDS
jgi:hypothetical protein